MEHVGRPFQVVPANVDERARPDERPLALVRRLATLKAVTVGHRYSQHTIVGADTVVALADEILGKPRDANQAREMLAKLSGRRHEVYTGVAVWRASAGRGVQATAIAHVTFRPVSQEEIEAYVLSGDPLDKAGAYGIQNDPGKWVQAFEGNLEAVIGLPTDLVRQLLR